MFARCRIVNLLQNMQKKIEEEGVEQQKMFEKFVRTLICSERAGLEISFAPIALRQFPISMVQFDMYLAS